MPRNPTALPPLPALQAFEAAARHESFMAAAQELNISQSAVSHRVRALERHLGYALFERLPRGLRLTENGKAYLPSIRSAFAEILGATTSIFGLNRASRLTIRAPLTYSALWLAEIVSRFSAAHPRIEIRMHSSVWAENLALDDTDVEIRLGYGHWAGYRAELLFTDPLVPLCSPRTLEAEGKSLDVADLASRPLVHIVGLEDQWHDFFAAHAPDTVMPKPKSHVHTDSSVAAATIAANGPHFCLLAETFAEHFERSGSLVRATDQTIASKQGVYLLTAERTGPLLPEVEGLKRWLRERAREQSICRHVSR
ncbi:LysR substrate-binding domain-containing protein [Defluviimonas salinarum]|uniref:LysR substrate-binding domain-containing protein n=1 Tax=Defluviimonas salinarum TaxID=2992147 RepID=A0ABT3JB23_9RHOB|nr:LysR substrate-binding domain-containing protein [Defluviimonas salinarum]MCW3784629.1 LysR substrate-binding domain-containing protein [Defluviimonas salinarum]